MKPDKAKSGPPATPAERTFVRRVLIVIALVALAFLLWQLRSVLLMLFGAVVVATILRALAEPIAKWTRLPEGVAVAIAALLIAGLIVGLAWMMGAQVSAQFETLTRTLPESWAKLEHWVQGIGLGEQLRNWQRAMADGGGSGIVSRVSGLALSFTSAFGNVLIVVFGGIFLAAEPQFYRSGAIKLVPAAKRALVAEAMDESEKALRLWLKGQLMAMIVVGAMTWFGLWLIGVESPLVLGLLAGALEFIPFAGPIIAAVPGIMLALAQSTDLALWAAGVYLIVQHSEAYLIQPLIQQYAVDLPAVILLFSLLAFGLLFGTLGVVLAAPLAVVSYVLVKRLYVVEMLDTPTPIPGEEKPG
jgi:predicted PurR-regulated permease PerM